MYNWWPGAHLVKTNHSRLLETNPSWGFVAQASHLKVEVARVEDGEDGDTPSSRPIWGGRCAPFMMLLNIVCVYLDGWKNDNLKDFGQEEDDEEQWSWWYRWSMRMIIWMECFLLSWYPAGRSQSYPESAQRFEAPKDMPKRIPSSWGYPRNRGEVVGNSSVDFYVFLGGGKWIWDIYVYYIHIHILFDINIYELYMMVYHTYL